MRLVSAFSRYGSINTAPHIKAGQTSQSMVMDSNEMLISPHPEINLINNIKHALLRDETIIIPGGRERPCPSDTQRFVVLLRSEFVSHKISSWKGTHPDSLG